MRCHNEIELQYCVNLWVWNEKLEEKNKNIVVFSLIAIWKYKIIRRPYFYILLKLFKAEKYVSFTLYKICHNMSVIYKVMHTAIKCLKKYVCVGKWKKTKSRIKKDKKYKDYNYLLAFYAFGILKIWMGEKEH